MLSIDEAQETIKTNLPGSSILQMVEYKDLYIFVVNTHLPEEELFDPFYSVNKKTGKFSDFSIIEDGNPEIHKLFNL